MERKPAVTKSGMGTWGHGREDTYSGTWDTGTQGLGHVDLCVYGDAGPRDGDMEIQDRGHRGVKLEM